MQKKQIEHRHMTMKEKQIFFVSGKRSYRRIATPQGGDPEVLQGIAHVTLIRPQGKGRGKGGNMTGWGRGREYDRVGERPGI